MLLKLCLSILVRQSFGKFNISAKPPFCLLPVKNIKIVLWYFVTYATGIWNHHRHNAFFSTHWSMPKWNHYSFIDFHSISTSVFPRSFLINRKALSHFMNMAVWIVSPQMRTRNELFWSDFALNFNCTGPDSGATVNAPQEIWNIHLRYGRWDLMKGLFSFTHNASRKPHYFPESPWSDKP